MSESLPPPLRFDDEGRLELSWGPMGEGWREAVCCECGQPIEWVLDMFSFKANDRGGFYLGHAECLWTPKGFDRVKKASYALTRREVNQRAKAYYRAKVKRREEAVQALRTKENEGG